jgi:hypothetical protein
MFGYRFHRHLAHAPCPDQRHDGVEQGITAGGTLEATRRDS